jgi:prepilin-type N-terminal cleavage/methylation domain-containing protein
MKGFTLIEVLLVTIIIGFIIAFSSVFYIKFSRSTFLMDEGASLVVNILNLARQKAIIGEENDNWGVLLINTSTNDYFYLLKGTNTLKQRYEIPSQITFFDFATKTIIFKKLTGETTSTLVKIGFSTSSTSSFRTIKIATSGSISVE